MLWKLRPDEQVRVERLARQLHELGPRALAEFLAELAAKTDSQDDIIDRLERYSRLDPSMLSAIDGHRFAPRPPLEVPRA
ncbi:hypothetical protein M2352_000329 [Azospirillum fermentarium]|uniref:hypothetical protein n=1 Tax=Azospirillum fermentarium TaxID=1233114 RepID=UPI00222606A1|nr:hypothetical protein [Azospirillum fermentarium]MCW2244738.1 hypothetical protein [Azospirillum fermentarium]